VEAALPLALHQLQRLHHLSLKACSATKTKTTSKSTPLSSQMMTPARPVPSSAGTWKPKRIWREAGIGKSLGKEAYCTDVLGIWWCKGAWNSTRFVCYVLRDSPLLSLCHGVLGCVWDLGNGRVDRALGGYYDTMGRNSNWIFETHALPLPMLNSFAILTFHQHLYETLGWKASRSFF
jgi:hypothetical protein